MSPRSQLKLEEIREEKIALIMDTALKDFANEGYHNTTISQIAKHAGISKGLMYNYFKSKEELLNRIVIRSIEDIFSHFNLSEKGHLTEEEFERFIRVLFNHVRKNLSFWRLFYQLILQKDVRDQFLSAYIGDNRSIQKLYSLPGDSVLSMFTSVMQDYFIRKKSKKPQDYDPVVDLNMFIYTLEGFTMVNAYLDEVDEYYDIAINRLIEIYK